MTMGAILSRMTSGDKPRFPITVWPGTPLAPVVVERRALTVRKNGKLTWGRRLDENELPDEWILRQLADADLDADDDVSALLAEFGTIQSAYFEPEFVPEDRWPLLAPTAEDGTLEDARWWLKTARLLARVWSETSRGGDSAPLWTAEGFAGTIRAHEFPWSGFAHMLSEGLEPFHARVEYHAGATVYGRPTVNLYSAACRQIFNLIAEGETARRCENQTCGRFFVRQLGGAEFGQHRSDARYCTPECARAEASRQYRRRQAAQQKEQQR